MPRWEIRFYDAPAGVKFSIELQAIDRRAAERAAIMYLTDIRLGRIPWTALQVGVVRELP